MQKVPDETYSYLFAVKQIKEKMMLKQSKAEGLMKILELSGIDYSADAVQVSPADKMADTIAEVVDLQREIKDLGIQAADKIEEITEMIEKLPDKTEALVLSEYYINRKTIEDIEKTIGYAERQTYRIKSNALMHFTEILAVNGSSDRGKMIE